MTEHTPLGYFKHFDSGFFQSECWAITGPDHDPEEHWDIIADGIPDEDFARFIVTACNNYEKVLDTLKGVQRALDIRSRFSRVTDTAFIKRLQRIVEPAIRHADEQEGKKRV